MTTHAPLQRGDTLVDWQGRRWVVDVAVVDVAGLIVTLTPQPDLPEDYQNPGLTE